METEIFTLFKNYHEKSFKEIKNELIERIESIKRLLISNNEKNNENRKSHICGFKRTRNRGYCKRLCIGEACVYHLKYIDKKDNKEDTYKNDNFNDLDFKKNNNEIRKQFDFPDKSIQPDSYEYEKDNDLNEKKKKKKNTKKLNKKKYMVEYKLLCTFINEQINNLQHKNIHIPHKYLEQIKDKINYDKNKFYDKNKIKHIIEEIKNDSKHIIEEIKNESGIVADIPLLLSSIVVYCCSLLRCFLLENYQSEDLIKTKKELNVL